MNEITIRNFAPGDERRMVQVQARCVAVCPDTGRFPPNFWLGPGFEKGQNIFCAVNGQDELLGYAAITPAYVSRHLKARTLWLDLRADPQQARASAIKEALFGRVSSRARELARRWPGERVALSATYFGTGQASIDYLKGKGFEQYQTCLYMRRDLAEPTRVRVQVDHRNTAPTRDEIFDDPGADKTLRPRDQKMFVHVRLLSLAACRSDLDFITDSDNWGH